MTSTIERTDARRTGGPALALRGVGKTFGAGTNAVTALRDIDLRVEPGEFVCLLGASGCGKSTLLNLVADLDAPTTGEVEVGTGRPSFMFQEAALLPWLTARRNVELALQLAGQGRRERRERADELLSLVRLDGQGDKRPHELSGGMRQRVSLARAVPACCSWTSPSRRSTPSRGTCCRPSCCGSGRPPAPRSCSSPTTSVRRSASPSASCCCRRGRAPWSGSGGSATDPWSCTKRSR